MELQRSILATKDTAPSPPAFELQHLGTLPEVLYCTVLFPASHSPALDSLQNHIKPWLPSKGAAPRNCLNHPVVVTFLLPRPPASNPSGQQRRPGETLVLASPLLPLPLPLLRCVFAACIVRTWTTHFAPKCDCSQAAAPFWPRPVVRQTGTLAAHGCVAARLHIRPSPGDTGVQGEHGLAPRRAISFASCLRLAYRIRGAQLTRKERVVRQSGLES